MNKTQLLSNLAGRDFVAAVSQPELRETKPDGTKWYSVNIRESKSGVGVYRNVDFYVVDEGGAGEEAFYKDAAPDQVSREFELRTWMLEAIDAAPDKFKGVQVHWVSERWDMVIFSMLIGDGANLKWQAFYIRKDAGGALPISNHDMARLQTVLNT